MLRKIVKDDKRVPLAIAEVFAHGARRVRSDVLHWRGLRSRRSDDNCVIQRAVIAEDFDHLRNRRSLLTDSAIDTNKIAALVVDDGVDGDCRFATLAVTND